MATYTENDFLDKLKQYDSRLTMTIEADMAKEIHYYSFKVNDSEFYRIDFPCGPLSDTTFSLVVKAFGAKPNREDLVTAFNESVSVLERNLYGLRQALDRYTEYHNKNKDI